MGKASTWAETVPAETGGEICLSTWKLGTIAEGSSRYSPVIPLLSTAVMPRQTGSVVVFSLLLSLFWAAGTAAQPLADRIDDTLRQRTADRAFWGLCVYDLERDSVLFSRNARRAFLPASNQKLFTTAAALDLLGRTHRYETTLAFRGTTRDSVMQGDLILEGSGAPTFGSTAIRGGDDPLRDWAERLAQMGVRRIEGRLMGNDEEFSDRLYPDGWNVRYLTRQKGKQIGISSSGLSYRDNMISARIQATQPGIPPDVRLEPSGIVDFENQAVTNERWRGSTLRITRTFSTNKIVLTGSVAQSYEGIRSVPVSNPTVFALRTFRRHLQEAGIETSLKLARTDTVAEEPGERRPLFVELSPPLSEIVRIINKRSNNFYAEQVFRTYGWGGSIEGGAQRTETFLQRAGIDPRFLSIADGSGLSRKNLVTPRAVMKLLVRMNEHPAREAFLSSLPRGGEPNTTLGSRLSQTSVWAKTGSLAFVRALSGYVERPGGTRIAFVVFANNYTGPSSQITRTVDEVVRLLASPPS